MRFIFFVIYSSNVLLENLFSLWLYILINYFVAHIYQTINNLVPNIGQEIFSFLILLFSKSQNIKNKENTRMFSTVLFLYMLLRTKLEKPSRDGDAEYLEVLG